MIHLRQGRTHDVVMMHMGPDGFCRIEPQAVNQLEIAGRERRRMRAEVVDVGAAAVVVDDEANVQAFRLFGALPGFAEQVGLLVGRQRHRFSDVNLRRLQPQNGRDGGIEDVVGGNNQQTNRAVVPLGETHDIGEQVAFGGRGGRTIRGVVFDIDAEHARRHHDDVSIARGLNGRDDVRERAAVAHGNQHVAGTHLHLAE